MDKNRIKGAAKQAEGRIQEAKGALTDNPTDRAAGQAKEFEGKAQAALGKAKDAVKKAIKEA